MKLLNLYSKIRVKKFKRKPKEIKNMNRKFENIVNRNWNDYKQDQLWVTDVSFIPCGKKFVYLSVLKDVATGFIVGYNVSEINDNKIYQDTWKAANKFHNPINPKIIHSDNGIQYTSIWAQRFAKENNLIISLSNPGCSLDNAACETFFSQLKTESPDVLKQNDFDKIKQIIDNYINYYNYTRITIKLKQPPAHSYLKQTKSHSL